jgi:Right handed beta helix region
MTLTPLRAALVAGVALLATLTSPASAQAGVVWVDGTSRGGACNDGHSALQASSALTPWCTLARAVAAAPERSTVHVRGGSYPRLNLNGRRNLTFARHGAETVDSAGASIANSQGIRFEGFRFSGGGVAIGAGANGVEIVRNEFASHGVSLVAGAANILIEGNSIHDINTGDPAVAIGASAGSVANVVVRGNSILRFQGDGVQFSSGAVQGLRIERNEIGFGYTDNPAAHNDAIQVIGGSNVAIAGNYIHDSEFGLMLGGEAPLTNFTLENNVIVKVGSHSMQVGEADNARIVNNTIWENKYGVLLRGESLTGVVLANNIIDNLQASPGMLASENYNLIKSGYRKGSGDLAGLPIFVAPGAGNYELAPGSPGIDAGAGDVAPALDRRGLPRMDDPATANKGAGGISFVDIGADERQLPLPGRGLRRRAGLGLRLAAVARLGLLNRRGAVRLTARCARACAIVARGKARLGKGSAGAAGQRGRAAALRFRPARERLRRRGRVTLTLRLPAKGRRTVSRALRRSRKVTVVIRLTARNRAGRRAVAKRRLTYRLHPVGRRFHSNGRP